MMSYYLNYLEYWCVSTYIFSNYRHATEPDKNKFIFYRYVVVFISNRPRTSVMCVIAVTELQWRNDLDYFCCCFVSFIRSIISTPITIFPIVPRIESAHYRVRSKLL